jgi:glycosyltransferase involved in cell wall biosynthesis
MISSVEKDDAQRVVLTVNARVTDQNLHSGGDDNDRRRTDFQELASALNATVIDWDRTDRTWIGRMIRKRFGFGLVAALLVFVSRKRYDLIWCFTEVEGLLLALLFKLFRIRKTLFFIAVVPVSPKSMFFMKHLRVWTHFTAILPTNTYQANELVRTAKVPADKVVILPYQVDCRYFTKTGNEAIPHERPLVVAVGLESRDYSTLIRAVTGLNIDVFIAAASLWSGDNAKFSPDIPTNVTLGSCGYKELRDLYARAAVAVVPLYESPYQHGITAIQEAMAMGLPVVVTRTIGQGDVVIDRRRTLRGHSAVRTQGNFAQMFRSDSAALQQSNGFYVSSGDAEELRKCICYLLKHREVAASLGAQGQLVAREVLSIELFVKRAERLVAAVHSGQRIHSEILQENPINGGETGVGSQGLDSHRAY